MAMGKGPLGRTVISTTSENNRNALGMDTLCWVHPSEDIVSNSLITIEGNEMAIFRSRGVINNEYSEMGQYELKTADKPVFGKIVQGLWGANDSPWGMEVIFFNKNKLKVSNKTLATTLEMAEIEAQIDYYIHIDSIEGAKKLIMHLPIVERRITVPEIADYAGPVIEQAVNKIIQHTPFRDVNKRIDEITEAAKTALEEFLGHFGISLFDLKIIMLPKDVRMRKIISMEALGGISSVEAVRYYLAMLMAEEGLVSAPNAAVGQPFTIGGSVFGEVGLDKLAGMSGGK